MKKSYHLLMIFLIILNSCEYVPTEVNYKEINKPEENPDINIVILDENNLTALRGEIKLSYSHLLNGKSLKAVNVYINDKYVTSGYGDNNSGAIIFDSREFPDGPYDITIDLLVSTNTGSLADKLGAEAYVLRKQYKTYIYNSDVIVPGIKKAEVENGALKLSWQKYTQPAFQKYIVTTGDYYRTTVGEITDVEKTYFLDSNYAGTPKSYTLETVVGGESFPSQPFPLYTWALMKDYDLRAEIINESQVKLSWKKSVFTKGLLDYKITRINDFDHKELTSINNVSDTIFIDNNPMYGLESQYNLTVEGKDGGSWKMGEIKVRKLGYDTKFEYPYWLNCIPEKNLLYICGGSYLFKADVNSLDILAEKQIMPSPSFMTDNCNSLSNNGTNLYYILTYFNKPEFAKLNPDNFEITKRYFIKNFTNENTEVLRSIAVSNNNILFACIRKTEYDDGTPYQLAAIDMNNEKLLSKIEITNSGLNIQTSPDGKYIICEDKLYRFDNNEFNVIGKIQNNAIFSLDFSSVIQVTDDSVLQILDTDNLALLDQFNVGTERYPGKVLHIDQYTRLLGIRDYSKYFIIDLEKRVVKKIINILGYATFFNGKLIFSNKYIEVNFGN